MQSICVRIYMFCHLHVSACTSSSELLSFFPLLLPLQPHSIPVHHHDKRRVGHVAAQRAQHGKRARPADIELQQAGESALDGLLLCTGKQRAPEQHRGCKSDGGRDIRDAREREWAAEEAGLRVLELKTGVDAARQAGRRHDCTAGPSRCEQLECDEPQPGPPSRDPARLQPRLQADARADCREPAAAEPAGQREGGDLQLQVWSAATGSFE
jgi:hypothetical protein